MTTRRTWKRREERKYKRIFVRYGPQKPEHRSLAMQISTRGLYLATNDHVFARGSPLILEFDTPQGPLQARGVVRHCVKVDPLVARYARPGMGVELVETPEALHAWLASL